jgi:hypothetical protein
LESERDLGFLAMASFSPLGGYISDRSRSVTETRWPLRHLGGHMAGPPFHRVCDAAQDARVASVVLVGGAGALFLSTSSFFRNPDIGGARRMVSGVMNMAPAAAR